MASLATACRASARIASRRRTTCARGLATSSRCLAAHNFTMPALSPTMTEGNIAAWKVRDGQAFSAGDVLLEIETDKATMDVEAQDDGVMFRVLAPDGSKAVQVGARIAVVADQGDDVNALEMPPDDTKPAAADGQSQPEARATKDARETGTEQPQAPRRAGDSSASSGQAAPARRQSDVRYPLMPAVEHLVKQNGLSEADVRGITPTGPNGRLLKGDVLAYLGTINADAPSAVSSLFEKLSHLDLSNVKAVPAKKPAAAAEPKPSAGTAAQTTPQPTRVNVPVSLARVVEVQNKIHDTLGVFLPLSTFISRAAEAANDDLPPPARPPTASELFDQVLGLDKVKAAAGGSRGVYLPQISAVPPPSMLAGTPAPARRSRKAADVFDEIVAPSRKAAPTARKQPTTVPGMSSGANVFSLVVPKGEERRAQVFLERCKLILEEEPGRLVL